MVIHGTQKIKLFLLFTTTLLILCHVATVPRRTMYNIYILFLLDVDSFTFFILILQLDNTIIILSRATSWLPPKYDLKKNFMTRSVQIIFHILAYSIHRVLECIEY